MGIGNYKIITGKVTGDVVITVNSQFNDVSATCVILSNNVTARLYGTIKGKLVLNEGSLLILHGTLDADIINRGGEIRVFAK